MPPKSGFVDVVVGGLLGVLLQFHPGLFGIYISLYFSTPEWSFINILRNQFRAIFNAIVNY